MSSLPLYWPLDADFSAMASGESDQPWQRPLFEQRYELRMLDTLSPIAGLSPDEPTTDPLDGLTQLAIIQPRGLSPADNAALDAWVRRGGRLLIALDPALTGDYELALGDPRLPSMTALIPPVIERWGLAVSFDDTQQLEVTEAELGGEIVPFALPGTLKAGGAAAQACTIDADGAAAQCDVGKGRVTVIADAAVFEHSELAGESGEQLAAVLGHAFN